MIVRNRETKKEYTMPRASWDKLGKDQKLFIIVDEKDEEEKKPLIIDNTVKPNTGEKVIIKDDKKTNTKQTKKN